MYPARYKTLDHWRGAACLSVIAFHSCLYGVYGEGTTGGGLVERATRIALESMHLGVPVFFVISGYCIAASADKSRRDERGFLDFMKRRIRRIYPPYYLTFALTGLAAVFIMRSEGIGDVVSPATLSIPQWIGNLTLTETIRGYLTAGKWEMVVPHAWTLCYEEQFYLICGLLLLARGGFVYACVAITLLTAGTLAMRISGINVFRGCFLDGQWLLFAAGMVCFAALRYRPRLIWPTFLLFAGACAALSVTYVHERLGTRRPDLQRVLFDGSVGFGTAAAMIALRGWDDTLNEVRLLAPLKWCGLMCYSLYLVHWPICQIVSSEFYRAGVRGTFPTLLTSFPVSLAISILVATPFYWFIERPFLSSKPHG